MINFGAVPASSVLPIFFDAFAGSTGASVTISGLAVTDIEVYKGTSMTQRSSDNGYTLLDTDGIDIDGITGIHGFSIDLSDNTDSGFYAAGSFYTVVVSAITVDSQTVSFVAATFRIVAAEGSAGTPRADVSHFGGTAGTFSGGRPEVNTTHAAGTAWGSGAITAASIASSAITSAKFAAGAIDAAAIADNAIDLATFAADAKALMGVIAFGTAQSVTGTTIRLASAETFADDELIGATVLIRSASTGAGQARVITDYVSSTDTATVDTWTTTPTGTITYVVFASAPASTASPIPVNVTQFGGTAGTFASGIPEVKVASIASGAITATSIASDAITAAKIADGAIDAATFASGAITAAAIAADAIGASELAADAVAEIADAVWDEALSGHAVSGSTGEALSAAGTAGDPWTTSLPGSYTGSQAGKMLSDILTDTAEIGAAGAGLTALATQSSVNTIDDFLDTEIAAIKAKTDNLPASPAAVGSAMTLTSAYDFAKGTAAATEAYAADGAAATPVELLYMIWSMLAEKNISSTTLTAKKIDGSTTAMTFTLNDATTPTAITRAT